MNKEERLSKLEAEQALAAMETSEGQVQIAGERFAGNYLLLWGAIYVLVPLTVIQLEAHAVWVANGLVALGVFVTVLLGVREPFKSEMGHRIGIFWWVIFSFSVVWMIILGGENFPRFQVHVEGRQTWAFGVTIAMLVFVLTGLLYSSKVLIGLGIGVTALTLAGFFVAWEMPTFYYWMAGCSGLPLLAVGLWFMSRRVNEKSEIQ